MKKLCMSTDSVLLSLMFSETYFTMKNFKYFLGRPNHKNLKLSMYKGSAKITLPDTDTGRYLRTAKQDVLNKMTKVTQIQCPL